MKLHVAEPNWQYKDGKRVIRYYKTLCGKKENTIEEAKKFGFMTSIRMDNPDLCKSCQNIMATNKYWKQYRTLLNTKKVSE